MSIRSYDIDAFIKKTSIELSLPEEIVDRIVRDQWKHANLAARRLVEIEIKDIGIFYPSCKKVYTKEVKLTQCISRIKNSSVIEAINKDIDLLRKTKYYDKSKRYMAEQEGNIGGD